MPKYNVKYSVAGEVKVVRVEAATPEEAAGAKEVGSQLLHVAESKRGRPSKQSLVPPDLA